MSIILPEVYFVPLCLVTKPQRPTEGFALPTDGTIGLRQEEGTLHVIIAAAEQTVHAKQTDAFPLTLDNASLLMEAHTTLERQNVVVHIQPPDKDLCQTYDARNGSNHTARAVLEALQKLTGNALCDRSVDTNAPICVAACTRQCPIRKGLMRNPGVHILRVLLALTPAKTAAPH